jgi:hypothetical protein
LLSLPALSQNKRVLFYGAGWYDHGTMQLSSINFGSCLICGISLPVLLFGKQIFPLNVFGFPLRQSGTGIRAVSRPQGSVIFSRNLRGPLVRIIFAPIASSTDVLDRVDHRSIVFETDLQLVWVDVDVHRIERKTDMQGAKGNRPMVIKRVPNAWVRTAESCVD